ncbi:MAG: HTTM domain-containing protein [Sandaracinaceae bacterium]|nr:HTTM domain-containing protein [Sandaracinaceae bacterium]
MSDRGTRSIGVRARELLAPDAPALDLAVLRVIVAVVLWLDASIEVAPAWAALPEAARTIPTGVGWLVPHLPIDPPTIELVRVLFRVCCAAGAVGLFTRASWVGVVLTASLLLLVPQLGGAVFHDHHLLWLAVIVAASPAGDALSIDAWWARRTGSPRPTHGRAHGLGVRLAWLVIGLVFFFPGVHKLAEAGWGWALSDNLRNQMWWKWTQDPSLIPSYRLDRHPVLVRGLAALTILFELAFLPAILLARTRPWAVLAACAFHAGAQAFMGIEFSVLWASYPMFVPWSAVWARLRPANRTRTLPTGTLPTDTLPTDTLPTGTLPTGTLPTGTLPTGTLPTGTLPTGTLQTGTLPTGTLPAGAWEPALVRLIVVATPLFLGIVTAGALGEMQGYPFACYPTFQWPAADRMPALELVATHRDGHATILDRSLFQEPGPRGWALSWRLAGVYGPFDPEALRAWWVDRAAQSALSSRLDDVDRIDASRVEIDVDPDGVHEVRSRVPLATLQHEGTRWQLVADP